MEHAAAIFGVVRSFKMLVTTYQTTRYHNSEYNMNLHKRAENKWHVPLYIGNFSDTAALCDI
jgi:hypothetical protein